MIPAILLYFCVSNIPCMSATSSIAELATLTMAHSSSGCMSELRMRTSLAARSSPQPSSYRLISITDAIQHRMKQIIHTSRGKGVSFSCGRGCSFRGDLACSLASSLASLFMRSRYIQARSKRMAAPQQQAATRLICSIPQNGSNNKLIPQKNMPQPSTREMMALIPFQYCCTAGWLPREMGMAVLIKLYGPPQKSPQSTKETMISTQYILQCNSSRKINATVAAMSQKTKKSLLSFRLMNPQSSPPIKTLNDQRMVTSTASEPKSREIRQKTIHETMKALTDLMNPQASTFMATPGSFHTVRMFTRFPVFFCAYQTSWPDLAQCLGVVSCSLPCEMHSNFLPCYQSFTSNTSSLSSTCPSQTPSSSSSFYASWGLGYAPSFFSSLSLLGMSTTTSMSMMSKYRLPKKKHD